MPDKRVALVTGANQGVGTGIQLRQASSRGETWFYDYKTRKMIPGVGLADPRWHPEDQPAPGPGGKVPRDWESHLH